MKTKFLQYQMVRDSKKRFHPSYCKNLPIMQILDKSIPVNLEASFLEKDLNQADYMLLFLKNICMFFMSSSTFLNQIKVFSLSKIMIKKG